MHKLGRGESASEVARNYDYDGEHLAGEPRNASRLGARQAQANACGRLARGGAIFEPVTTAKATATRNGGGKHMCRGDGMPSPLQLNSTVIFPPLSLHEKGQRGSQWERESGKGRKMIRSKIIHCRIVVRTLPTSSGCFIHFVSVFRQTLAGPALKLSLILWQAYFMADQRNHSVELIIFVKLMNRKIHLKPSVARIARKRM